MIEYANLSLTPEPPLRSTFPANLFDLQENAVLMDRNEDDDTDTEKYWLYEPPQELADMMFERRLATEASSSPVASRHTESRRGSTVADTDGKTMSISRAILICDTKLALQHRATLLSCTISRPQIHPWDPLNCTRDSVNKAQRRTWFRRSRKGVR